MQESMDTILVYGKNDFENDLEGDFRIETNNLYFAEMLGKCCYNVSKLCDHFVKRSDKTLSLSLSLSFPPLWKTWKFQQRNHEGIPSPVR